MNSSASNDPELEPSTTDAVSAADASSPAPNDHPDPLTGEPNAHPLGVGAGALAAGAIGAGIGAFAGPIGVVIGAAVGAIAGGLAGKEAAEAPEVSPVSDEGGTLDEFDHAPGTADAGTEVPLPASISDRTSPTGDDFFNGGTMRDADAAETPTPLDDFDRPHAASPTVAAVPVAHPVEEDPLPTASSGLITPDESSFFADSTTGESSILADSPLPAAHAVSAEADESTSNTAFSATSDFTTSTSHLDAEHTVRTTAYYRYLDRENTGRAGDELGDWVEAEKEVRQA